MARRAPFQVSLLDVERDMVGLMAREHALSMSALVAKLVNAAWTSAHGHLSPASVVAMLGEIESPTLNRIRVKTAAGRYRRSPQ